MQFGYHMRKLWIFLDYGMERDLNCALSPYGREMDGMVPCAMHAMAWHACHMVDSKVDKV
jgi:hypothetical protein